MKILHIGLADHFTEGMTYQDNILTEMNCLDGHEVVYIGDVFTFREGKLVQIPEEDRILPDSMRLIRVKYDFIINNFISSKIQKVSSLKFLLEEIAPDVILFHGLFGRELLTVKDYVISHKETVFLADAHCDRNNTARNPVSRMAYKVVHGYFLKQALPYISKILYITESVKDFLIDLYQIPGDKLEWFPLGGKLIAQDEKKKNRELVIKELKLAPDSVILGHSGKLSSEKRTKDLISAFSKVTGEKMKLLIWGKIQEEIEEELLRMIAADDRIYFLGWKKDTEIYKLLSACDIYCQPGSQSATLQSAMCCGCAVIVYPHYSYKVFIRDNGFFTETQEQLEIVLRKIADKNENIESMCKKSYEIAREVLDYSKLAERLYQKND